VDEEIMPTRSIFPTLIYESTWKNFEDKSKEFISKIKPYLENNLASGNEYVDKNGNDIFKRTNPNLQNLSEFREVVDFIEYHGKEYWRELGYTNQQDPYILQLWANEVPPGGFTPAHNHNPVAIGGVLYLDADPTKGNLYLEDPNQMIKGRSPYDWQYKPYLYTEEIKIESGKMIMFPGYLMHHTRSNRSNTSRYVFGFNFGLSWTYKSKP
jgi:uncharacterized protein (TIGR02466 family)